MPSRKIDSCQKQISTDRSDLFENLYDLLSVRNLAFLLGAGISKKAGIPLIGDLTKEVKSKIEACPIFKSIFEPLTVDLNKNVTIEKILDHLIDFISLAHRTKNKKIKIGKNTFEYANLTKLHYCILRIISETIREKQSNANLDHHREFVKSRYQLNKGRSPVSTNFFTTNYDTLLENALALEQITYSDGTIGGDIAFFHDEHGWQDGRQANLFKLHGSIDWYQTKNGIKIRASKESSESIGADKTLLIHPQSTKYQMIYRNPFALQFSKFRELLNTKNHDDVLVVCGFGFGDDHIKDEILNSSSTLSLIVFIKEFKSIPSDICKVFDSRLWVVDKQGVKNNHEVIEFKDGRNDAWKFSGLIRLLNKEME